MKRIIAAALAGVAALTAASAAEARQGCGPAFHRNYRGFCVPNRGRALAYAAPGQVVGRFYHGRGYWDGRRYYQQRYRYQQGWRYR